MSPYIGQYKKNIAIEMRRKGMSYSEIENQIHVPKSTLSFWLKNLKLTPEQTKKLDQNKIEGLKRGSVKKIRKTLQMIADIKKSSASDIKGITKKELWLMGIILYWRERLLSGNENDLRKGVKFTSSDPYLIKFFLKWLKEIGGIKNDEIQFDIFVGKDKKSAIHEIIEFWSEVVGVPEQYIFRIYFLKNKPKNKLKNKKKERKIINKTNFGLLRIRVKASSMLARQIAGWVRGIIRYYWD